MKKVHPFKKKITGNQFRLQSNVYSSEQNLNKFQLIQIKLHEIAFICSSDWARDREYYYACTVFFDWVSVYLYCMHFIYCCLFLKAILKLIVNENFPYCSKTIGKLWLFTWLPKQQSNTILHNESSVWNEIIDRDDAECAIHTTIFKLYIQFHVIFVVFYKFLRMVSMFIQILNQRISGAHKSYQK